MYRKLNDRNQITLPAKLLKTVGVGEGDLFEIIATPSGGIMLMPRQIETKSYPDTTWKKLGSLVREQRATGAFTEYRSIKGAKQHLRKKT